jgi:hypothetical protein
MSVNLEFKGIIDVILNNFKQIMDIKPFQPSVNRLIRKDYLAAMEKIEGDLKPNINFIPEEEAISFLNEYVFQNLQKHSDEIGDSLRQELQRGLLNKETAKQLKQRIKNVFNDSKYTNRLKTVIRTERIRASNKGALDGATQAQESGVKLKKYLDAVLDDRTTDICKAEDRKYGSKEQAIPLDQDFIVKVGNKTYKALAPPFHINCRTVLRFVQEKEDGN